MVRRNYQGWSYSPLTQITRDNVKDLQLAWVWAMNEGQAQPADAARAQRRHLSQQPGNIIQALDAKTGELIWENRVGPNAAIGIAAMRGMAIYRTRSIVADHRRAAGGARRADRQEGVGDDDRRSREGLRQHQRPDRRQGQGDSRASAGCDRLRQRRLLHQRLRRRDRQAAVEVRHRRAQRRARRRHLGRAGRQPARRRRNVDHRQLRSGSRTHLLGHRAGQAVDAARAAA